MATRLKHRFTTPLDESETALLEAIGMKTAHCRVLVRRRLTIVLDRHSYLPGLTPAVMTFALVYRHGLLLAGFAAGVAWVAMSASLLAHEAGHLLFARSAEGIEPRMIVMRAAGGVSVVEGRYANARDAALFAMGGPLASLVACAALELGGVLLPAAPFGRALIVSGFVSGLLLAMNMIPIAPTDGYQLFRSAVWAEVRSRKVAERLALDWSRAMLGWALALSLVALRESTRYGILALVVTATFAAQHHAVARRAAAQRVRLPRHR